MAIYFLQISKLLCWIHQPFLGHPIVKIRPKKKTLWVIGYYHLNFFNIKIVLLQ
jgi:hypothetical protein